MIAAILGLKMGSPRVGRCLKSFLEVVRFTVTKYGAVGSHGDQILCRNDGCGRIFLWMQRSDCVHTEEILLCTEEIYFAWTE